MELKEEIRNAYEVLKNGGVILYPTDTIWGIGCDATNEEAVKRIYKIKKRENSKSMLLLVDDVGWIASYASVPDIALDLINTNDKPMTIIYPNAKGIAKNLIAEDGTIGIRVTNEEFSKKLTFRLRKPIVSTSANISGKIAPQNFCDISQEIKDAVDYIVDYRQDECSNHKASSILKIEMNGNIKIIRK